MKVSDINIEKLGEKPTYHWLAIFRVSFFCFCTEAIWILFTYIDYNHKIAPDKFMNFYVAFVISIILTAVITFKIYELVKDYWMNYILPKISINYKDISNSFSIFNVDRKPYKFGEFVDRIATFMITNGSLKKKNYEKLKQHMLDMFVHITYRGAIFQLWKTGKLNKDCYFILSDERDYWDIVNKMIELGIIPIKSVACCEFNYGTFNVHPSYVIFLANQEDFNLFKLSYADNKKYTSIRSNEIFETIDKVLNDKVDTWIADGYGHCYVVPELIIHKSEYGNTFRGNLVMNLSGSTNVTLPNSSNQAGQNIQIKHTKGP